MPTGNIASVPHLRKAAHAKHRNQRFQCGCSGFSLLESKPYIIRWDFDLGFGEHDVEGELAAAAEVELVPIPPFFLFWQWRGTAAHPSECDVGVTLWEGQNWPGCIEEQEKFLICPDTFDDFGIVKTKFFKPDGGWREKGPDEAEIFL